MRADRDVEHHQIEEACCLVRVGHRPKGQRLQDHRHHRAARTHTAITTIAAPATDTGNGQHRQRSPNHVYKTFHRYRPRSGGSQKRIHGSRPSDQAKRNWSWSDHPAVDRIVQITMPNIPGLRPGIRVGHDDSPAIVALMLARFPPSSSLRHAGPRQGPSVLRARNSH